MADPALRHCKGVRRLKGGGGVGAGGQRTQTVAPADRAVTVWYGGPRAGREQRAPQLARVVYHVEDELVLGSLPGVGPGLLAVLSREHLGAEGARVSG